jgi:biotin transport system substrate-specific component
MQILTNRPSLIKNLKHSLITGAFLLLVVLGAKIDLDLGGMVSFTLQTLFLGLAYYFLPIKWRLVLIVVYLSLGIIGVPVFNGGVGWAYFSSWPVGFFIGFIAGAFIPTSYAKSTWTTLTYFFTLHIVVVLLGVVGMFYSGGSFSSPLDIILELLPGAIIKSILGVGIVIIWEKKVKPGI